MTSSIAPEIRLSRLNAVTDPMAGGVLEFWAAPRPASGGTPTGALQASTTLPAPAGTTNASSIVFAFNAINDALRVDSQVITWARFKSSTGAWIMDVSVGLATAPSNPPEEILLGNVAGAVGAFLHISTGTFAG